MAAIDRLWRRKEITTDQRRVIIATVIKRARGWSEGKDARSNITCVSVNNQFLNLSRESILVNQISADDALHIYTGYAKDCEFFVFRDKRLKRQFARKIHDMRLINLSEDKDIQELFDSLDSS